MGNIVKKILVANRGEIALRVVRTAREMGISTVAVYSEQDRNAQYVQLADESYLLSGDTYASTYLNEDLLIGILHRSGANAVHPGYGFLSEVPSFADKVEKAGAIWVGPHPQALIDLGDKITARRVAKSAQVPPVPGISEPVRELRTLLDFSHTYGYPVMMKRTDGGGGRGITVVHDDDEMRRFYMNHDAMQGGDLDEYFIEKFIDKARHVETQCGRDRFGDFTVYSTRDCSVQRRNQKLVEEAPAPFLPDEVINQLETYSRSLFNKVDYIGLGTCEFMVTPHRKVYFLEVNPRLQVEHTVSEEVCGLDLVREQIDIADGGHLTPAPAPRGHSFELRITSEDPATNLTPSSGTLERIVWPSGPGLRIDTGVEQGDTVSPKFDSMMGKVVITAQSREAAVARVRRALDELVIEGVPTPVSLFKQIFNDDEFTAEHGHLFDVSTKWLERKYLNHEPQTVRSGQPASLSGEGPDERKLRHRGRRPPCQAHRADRHRQQPHGSGAFARSQAPVAAAARPGAARHRGEEGAQRRQVRRHRLAHAGGGHAHQRRGRPVRHQGRPAGGAGVDEDGELRVRAGQRHGREDLRRARHRRRGRRDAGRDGRRRRQGARQVRRGG